MDQNLKREIILEHYQHPKNRGLIDDDSYIKVNTNNESCIDEINLMVKLDNNKIVGMLTLGDLAKYSQDTGKENFSNTFEEICDCGHKNNR